MDCQENAGNGEDNKTDNESFENGRSLKYRGTTVTN